MHWGQRWPCISRPVTKISLATRNFCYAVILRQEWVSLYFGLLQTRLLYLMMKGDLSDVFPDDNPASTPTDFRYQHF